MINIVLVTLMFTCGIVIGYIIGFQKGVETDEEVIEMQFRKLCEEQNIELYEE